jgi:hypothetical protein
MTRYLASNGVTVIETSQYVTFQYPGDLWTGVHLSQKTVTALREYFTTHPQEDT